jgi:hypothetical protein
MNLAKTTYSAALVAAALSCMALAMPAHADHGGYRPRYSHEYRGPHDGHWVPPGHRYYGYDRGYRSGYRDGRYDDRRDDYWRYRDRHWRGGYYGRPYYGYGSSYWSDRYPRYRWRDGYDGDLELRVRIPF